MKKNKKIIHIDMDYFFAQVEILSRPELKDLPVAIGSDNGRGVICTCNYIAREYGVRSAMPSFRAKSLCPELIFIKPDMAKYRNVSNDVFNIFSDYTYIIEGLSLDEAFLDVTDVQKCKGSATLIAQEIKNRIFCETGLTASAGVSFNKLLSKLASDYNKPNGICIVPPGEHLDFVSSIPIGQMQGVGEVTKKKMDALGIETFLDLQKFTKLDLINIFGKFGCNLYYYARGIDNRSVEKHHERKTLSVENTFTNNIKNMDEVVLKLHDAYSRMLERLSQYKDRFIKSHFVKIKYSDFTTTTVECRFQGELKFENFLELCLRRTEEDFKSIRLLGTGVRFYNTRKAGQLELPMVY